MYAEKGVSCSGCMQKGCCTFKKLRAEESEKLFSEKRTLVFEKGEALFHMGDFPRYFYCINSGRVQLYRSNPHREQSFTILTSGWLGHRDILAGDSYRHGARALCRTVVCKLHRDVLTECMVRNPEFSRELIGDLARGWVDSENQSYNLGARKTMERMADYILRLEKSGGENPSEVNFPLTREIVATLIGATTESVIRTLSDFKARGWIEMQKGKLLLNNEEALTRLVSES